jgi:4-aminobutyrate aminotransferase-like enzyme/Ser/Thr protein kinase RdoA (MazF antagonist)
MTLVQHAPRFTVEDAAAIARDCFGFEVGDGGPAPLPSERDQNFRLCDAQGRQAVLKIANALEEYALLEAQNGALLYVAEHAPAALCPQPLTARDGSTIMAVTGGDGRKHWVRLLSYIDGKPLALVKPHDEALLADLGGFMGRLDGALAGYDHPALHRTFHWDVAQAADVIGQYKDEIADPQRRALIERLYRHFAQETLPKLGGLRHAAIHGDANDYNVLVRDRQVAGILDFGDMVYSVVAADVAIAAAYALLDKPEPLAAIAAVVGGYHQAYSLGEDEVAAIFDLTCMRLCMSVCHAAHQRRHEPDNEYLSISERPAWAALERLAQIHPRLAHYTLRVACGMAPVPQTEQVVAWLRGITPARVVDADLRSDSVKVLDLSIGSPLLQSRDLLDGATFTVEEEAGARAGGARNRVSLRNSVSSVAAPDLMPLQDRHESYAGPVAIGRYDEARAIYMSQNFAVRGSPLGERRTIHLGIDIFAPPETPVYAPIASTVHALANNTARQDYGPVIVLKHETEDGTPFYTLYGHLTVGSLEGVQVGQNIAAGEQVGAIGAPPSNGDWPPHLHLQIITDLLELDTDFPGVAAPSQRAVYLGLSPDPNVLLGIPEAAFPPAPPSKAETLAERRKRIGYNLSISYREPLKIVRGLGVHLYDDAGQPYLDCVNNVAHVGHCHPHVVAAGQRQMGVLNTNTRYLHDSINRYAERLAGTLPEPLCVCFFVNSGSEANDLALRLARAATGQFDMITLDVAYHGHTQALIEVSPYKHDGPGGRGAPPFVQTVVMPDPYRGLYRGYGEESGRAYAGHVQSAMEAIQAQGRGVAGFICESLMGCGGQIVFPDGFMAAAFDHVRAAGGICIADEVQTGLGRVGSHFWGFETQGVIPDIVTVGKPAGNGHPLAAVITTAEIAQKFANGMEYFNTFGGNAVSCEIGLAVLDVIEQEGLQANALDVGNYLMARLRGLMDNYPLIGDVRGLGLYIGAELVLDRETREPAGEHASYIANRMRDLAVLISTDGPDHNVLKIKPPVVFSRENADRLVDSLAVVLEDDAVRV